MDFEQLMLFKPEDIFKAVWKDRSYKTMRIEIDREPCPKQADRSKIIPKGKGLGKLIGHEYYYRIEDLFINHYQPRELMAEVEKVKLIIKSQCANHIPFENEVIISKIDFIFKAPSSFSKKQMQSLSEGNFIEKTTKPDMDNLQKFLWDCCTGIIWKDDAKIWWMSNIRKRYGVTGKTIMELYGR